MAQPSSKEIYAKVQKAGLPATGGAVSDSENVKITHSGVYRIIGALDDGKLKVDTDSDDETVVLVLDNAPINNTDGAWAGSEIVMPSRI